MRPHLGRHTTFTESVEKPGARACERCARCASTSCSLVAPMSATFRSCQIHVRKYARCSSSGSRVCQFVSVMRIHVAGARSVLPSIRRRHVYGPMTDHSVTLIPRLVRRSTNDLQVHVAPQSSWWQNLPDLRMPRYVPDVPEVLNVVSALRVTGWFNVNRSPGTSYRDSVKTSGYRGPRTILDAPPKKPVWEIMPGWNLKGFPFSVTILALSADSAPHSSSNWRGSPGR